MLQTSCLSAAWQHGTAWLTLASRPAWSYARQITCGWQHSASHIVPPERNKERRTLGVLTSSSQLEIAHLPLASGQHTRQHTVHCSHMAYHKAAIKSHRASAHLGGANISVTAEVALLPLARGQHACLIEGN